VRPASQKPALESLNSLKPTAISAAQQSTEGTLEVLNTSGSAHRHGPVVISAGATLGGTGSIAGDVTNNGVLNPGSTIGTLHNRRKL